jgi:hypothetical protein
MIEAHHCHSMRILSYCVFSNHWHFVVWPETDGQVTKKKGRAMRANVPEWEPGRRGTLETLPSDFVPHFPGSRGFAGSAQTAKALLLPDRQNVQIMRRCHPADLR